MGLLTKFVGMRRGTQAVAAKRGAADLKAAQDRAGRLSPETLQTSEEQAAIRQRMEAELDAQRARRAQA